MRSYTLTLNQPTLLNSITTRTNYFLNVHELLSIVLRRENADVEVSLMEIDQQILSMRQAADREPSSAENEITEKVLLELAAAHLFTDTPLAFSYLFSLSKALFFIYFSLSNTSTLSQLN
jgi:hypothetical protein